MHETPAMGSLAAISLGSNIEPDIHLPAAVKALSQLGDVVRVSQAWESAPVGDTNQANFWNAAVLWRTDRSLETLKEKVLRPIEDQLGRVRDPNNINAARTIDLDLSFWITEERTLCFEDEITSRAFVIVPLAEILPELVHPQIGVRLSQMAKPFAGELTLRTDCQLQPMVAD